MERIPVAGPWITPKEIGYVADAAASAWYGQANKYHERFERAFADHLGVKHAMALPSCTSAIHLSLLTLGIGPGDEVVVPDITWIATAAPISYVGATPVFADVDPLTWCLAADSLEACVTPRTKALIPVDLYGNLPDMAGLLRVARKHHLAIVEDAAQAVGAEWNGRKAGSFGTTGVFSFHGSKTLTTGEGGMLVTDRGDLYQRAGILRDHGRLPGDRLFRNHEVAYKYKMSSLQAALGLAQLERLEELIARKREAFRWYRERLGNLPGVTLNHEAPGTRNAYWMVTLIPSEEWGLRKEQIIDHLNQRGIDSRPFFYPLSSLPAYAHLPGVETAKHRNPVSYRLGALGVNLPSALNLTEASVDRVCAAVREIMQ
jgi:perosamine synthetase